MSDSGAWLRLVLAILATWRVTHLLALEDGPWDIIARMRMRLGDSFFGRLLDCFYCLSLWVSAFIVMLMRLPLTEWPLWWLACSGGACLLERFGPQPDRFAPVDRLDQEDTHARGESHGMLRTASGDRSGSNPGPGDENQQSAAGPS
jgi:Protein of unknown function (DUF1360)